MQTLKFGLAGYGSFGKCHALAIQQTPGCELSAVCTASGENRKAAEKTGAATFADLDSLFASDVDIVDIVLPNHLHEQAACAALSHGKHVLLEKPMSIGVASCDRIIRAAKAAGKLLLVGHELRFSAMYSGIRKLIDDGRIGDPRYMLIDLWRRPYRPGSGGWRADPARVGNWTLEEPVHHFDLAGWYLESNGEPSSVFAYGNRMDSGLSHNHETNDHFTAVVSYPNRAYAVISQSLSAVEHHIGMRLFGSKATLRAEWHAEMDRSERPSYTLEISEQGNMKSLEVPSTPGELFELQAEIAAMAGAVRDGSPLPIAPEEARRAVMLCLEATRSLETGEVVRLRPHD